jgi:hypothetical protein
MVGGIMSVFDLIDPELPATNTRAPPRGVIDKCQRALGWLQQFVKEAEEYAGAHVLSMVRAHYLLINFKRLELGYPKEVGPKQADELRIELLDLSASIIGDINLCGTSSPPVEEPSSSTQLPRAAVSTSQSPVPESSSAERSEAAVSTSQTPVALASSTKAVPPSSSSEKAKSSAQPEPRVPTSQ